MLTLNTWRLQEILRDYRRSGRMMAATFSPLGGWFALHPFANRPKKAERISLTTKDNANAS